MDGSFHASRLQAESPGGEYRLGQPMAAEVFTGGKLLADVAGTLTTPWRVLAMGTLKTGVFVFLSGPGISGIDFVSGAGFSAACAWPAASVDVAPRHAAPPRNVRLSMLACSRFATRPGRPGNYWTRPGRIRRSGGRFALQIVRLGR